MGNRLAPAVARAIEGFRKDLPGRWEYIYDGGSEWHHESGLVIRAEAAMAPRFDGDDDSFRLQYRRQDTGEQVWPGHGQLSTPKRGA